MKNLMINKAFLTALASVFISSSALADDGLKIQVVSNVEGAAPVEYVLDDILKITFQENDFTIVLKNGNGSTSFDYMNTQKMVFDNIKTGIENVHSEKAGDIAITYDGNYIRVSGCSESAQLRLYDISGRPLLSQTVKGDTEISTENLSAGVYIMKVNSKTFKFSKR